MKYFVMLAMVIGLAVADWITGFIKAYAAGKVKSNMMRIGGIKKLAEITIMLVGIGLDIAITYLSKDYPDAKFLSDILGNFCAITVCAYITIMELVSILENFAAIYPGANWSKAIAKKLSNIESIEKEEPDANK